MYAFFDRIVVHWFTRSLVHWSYDFLFLFTRNPLKPTTVSILLSSLFFYFFQYVKERVPLLFQQLA